jgi:hypothetical protein
LAAAYFNAAAPSGWHATTAGQDPAAGINPLTLQLMKGSAAEPYLDVDPPRPLAAVTNPDRIVAIDCQVPGAEQWNLVHQEMGEALRDELARRVNALTLEGQGDDPAANQHEAERHVT